jgi:hypothetical protein
LDDVMEVELHVMASDERAHAAVVALLVGGMVPAEGVLLHLVFPRCTVYPRLGHAPLLPVANAALAALLPRAWAAWRARAPADAGCCMACAPGDVDAALMSDFLELAIDAGSLDALEFAVAALGADVSDGRALRYAAAKGDVRALELLVARGADVHAGCCSLASGADEGAGLPRLSSSAALALRPGAEATELEVGGRDDALLLAVGRGHDAAVLALLRLGADALVCGGEAFRLAAQLDTPRRRAEMTALLMLSG